MHHGYEVLLAYPNTLAMFLGACCTFYIKFIKCMRLTKPQKVMYLVDVSSVELLIKFSLPFSMQIEISYQSSANHDMASL